MNLANLFGLVLLRVLDRNNDLKYARKSVHFFQNETDKKFVDKI